MGTCVNNIAKNIGMDCDAPIVSGFTGRGVLIPLSISEMRINSQAKLYCKAFILIMLFIGVFHNLLSPVMKMMPYVLE